MPLTTLLTTLNHRHVVSSPSTNSELIDAVQAGTLSTNEPQLLTADTQTAGRGQRGRSWQSPQGNVYLSLYHPMQMPISGLLSLVIGAELAKMPVIQTLNDQLRAQGLAAIGVKWANDLGFYQTPNHSTKEPAQHSDTSINPNKVRESDDAHNLTPPISYFNKLAGILIEPVWQSGKLIGVVMGVGLNVRATPALTTQTSEGMSYQAISLQDIYETLNPSSNNSDLSRSETMNATLPSLQDLYRQISHALITAITCFEQLAAEKLTAHTQYADEFMTQFAAMDALTGLRLQVSQNHNDQLHITTGYACGIDTHGCLQLRQDNGKLSALFTGRIDVINEV
ncbi:BirA family biotin operon repressor/biotin-[acetyl-CoA-carboxylase] ligase [Psychrobacter sp. PL15]|uniref:biotin--[acetyl-CoA-carboxylase] ligase n=1 Tax=Psychrobacter sp. PL15 TaxID=3071719 RepID=UPI002E0B8859|nr:BirA family biotin operon repressor/biotin-[acetyl-CoA-carboxylase] ligase [Psychrobacter sp. PL15]